MTTMAVYNKKLVDRDNSSCSAVGDKSGRLVLMNCVDEDDAGDCWSSGESSVPNVVVVVVDDDGTTSRS